MDDNRVFGNNALEEDDEWGNLDYQNLEAPMRWRYDEKTGRLHMLLQDGKKPRPICVSAQMGEKMEFYQIATLATSQQVILWYTDECAKLNVPEKH